MQLSPDPEANAIVATIPPDLRRRVAERLAAELPTFRWPPDASLSHEVEAVTAEAVTTAIAERDEALASVTTETTTG